MRGQVGLLLLVIMGAVIALVMSVASRSLSDTVLSRQEKESSEAFSVAETGVETAMNAIRNGDIQSGGNISGLNNFVSGDYAIAPKSSYGLYIKEGETAHLDLTGFNVANSLTISWTKKSDATENLTSCSEGSGLAPAAIELSAFQAGANTVIKSYYNPYNCALSSNAFTSSIDGGTDYRSKLTYIVPTSTTSIRVKPLYSGATIQVAGTGLTTQLYQIESQASGGDAQKEIEVKRGLDAPPSIFDFAVFSAGTIVK